MKRNFTIIVLLCVMFCLTACLPEKGVKTTAEQAKRNFFAMSTDFSITAYSDNAEAALTAAEERVKELEKLWSATDSGSDWRLGLRDPFGEGNVGAIEISDMAVVTSGNYERYFIGEDGREYGHIINPTTGYPVSNGLASVTIIAKEGKMCDALSTALFVMGADEAVNYWQQNKDFDMILITNDNEIYLTEGVKDKFNLSNSNKYACYVITDK